MYLKKSTRKSTGRTHLSIVHNYNDNGVSRTHTIKTLGYLDELKERYDDPIAYFTDEVARLEAERKAACAPLTFSISPQKRLRADEDNRKNLGFAALSGIYHELGLDVFLSNRQRSRDFNFSVNAALKLLVYSRILDPGSKKRAFENKGSFFEDFDLSLDDIYHALGFLDTLSTDIQLLIHRKIAELYRRDTSLVYYDVTNYYFEIDEQDELRRKGMCKEHRPDPIVQMGLLMDRRGLPIAFDVFSGNTADCLTLLPTLKDVKARFAVKRIVVVADKGLNTSDNIAGNLARGDGYVFSQSVRKTTAELKGWTTADAGYVSYGGVEDFKCKSRIATRILHLEDGNGKKRDREITEKQVAFYSARYDRRAKAQRADAVAKARELAANPARFDKATSYGAAKYVKGIQYDKKTGEIIAEGRALSFDEDKLAAEEALDGYYVIVTSEMEETDAEIIEMYKGLWKIEESFKVTKSDLRARPVYVSRQDHIRAHFLTCFIALVIVRILELKTQNEHSPAVLIETLKAASGSLIEDNWYLFDHFDDVLDDIGRACDIDFTRKILNKGAIRKLLGATKKNPRKAQMS